MSGPSGSPVPPPPPPPDGTWTPPPPVPAPLPSASFAERFGAETMHRRGPWKFAGVLAEGVGLLLVFLGTVIVIAFGSTPIDCIATTTTCAQGTLQGVANALVLGHLFWAFGLFGLAAGAGLQLYLTMPPGPSPTPEETRIYLSRRRGEYILMLASLGLLFLLMLASAFSGFAIA